MNTRYVFQGVTIDEKTKEYIEKKLSTIEKLVDAVIEALVEIELDKKGKYRVEIMIKTAKVLYRAEEISESIEGSVDIAEEEIKNQIRHKKERLSTLQRRGGRSIKKKMVVDEALGFDGLKVEEVVKGY